jgi:serine/threonine-protein kinase
MAPEQLSGGDVSRVSDVFAAAVVLWEVLAGERLFAGENHAATVFKLMSAPIQPPSTRRAGLAPALDAIVLRGLQRDPAQRYATAHEMALALERAAPSVRPSEIAGWVERVVADRLAPRARILSAIEGSEDSDTEARTVLRERSASTRHPPEVESGTQRKQLVAAAKQGRARRTLVGGGLVALLSLLGVVTWTLSQRRTPEPSAFRSRAQAPEKAAPLAPGDGVALGTPPAAPGSAPPAAILDASAEAVSHKRPVRSSLQRPGTRIDPARKGSNQACDPPYRIDNAGRVLFKVECM